MASDQASGISSVPQRIGGQMQTAPRKPNVAAVTTV